MRPALHRALHLAGVAILSGVLSLGFAVLFYALAGLLMR